MHLCSGVCVCVCVCVCVETGYQTRGQQSRNVFRNNGSPNTSHSDHKVNNDAAATVMSKHRKSIRASLELLYVMYNQQWEEGMCGPTGMQ